MTEIIESTLLGKINCDLLIKWLNDESLEGAPEDCILFCYNRTEFVAYFLSFLRAQTDGILQTNSNAIQILNQTPEKLSRRKHQRSISDPGNDNEETGSAQESPNSDKRKTGRRVKTKLFTDEKSNQSISSDESRLSAGVERIVISSTPLKNGIRPDFMTSPVTPTSKSFSERCDTPRLSRHSRSQDKSISLGDYLITAQSKSTKKKRSSKNASNEDIEPKRELDLSNSEMFPEIGARKSSSLRSERRRINPTNIDKSVSLNSFTDAFQQPSLGHEENIAFKPKLQPKDTAKNFDAERNILRQERHKLMEKFNILNTNAPPKAGPQIKILQKEEKKRQQHFIDAEANKIVLKEKIDILIEIYDVLFKNNLILSINTEIYFLITILLSKQDDEDLKEIESELNNVKYILKSIHNSTYFAVKSLWNLRSILEVILDKNSLKTLGENKKVRSFFPDLAKFLLNSYGLKCEADTQKKPQQGYRVSNGMVCFNSDTDNSDNFTSLLSFQNFKKQRDMFYEILRWYEREGEQAGAARGAMLRARTRSLLAGGASGAGAATHGHLAALLVRLLAECALPSEQESKLSKLQRRLTCPNAPESHRLPHFTDKEMFYKEFIMYAESECFRVHLRDALASEIVSLDSTPVGSETSNGSDSSEFLAVAKKLCLLAKFLGYLVALPYAPTSPHSSHSTSLAHLEPPKGRVLENNLALRSHSQPNIDLIGLLTSAYENSRLYITLPWVVHYLSMQDYTTLRTRYYQKLIEIIFFIYEMRGETKKITDIFLKSTLGWLFDLPHFPREFYTDKMRVDLEVKVSSDTFDLIDESVLVELCPFLKDINVLLTYKVTGRDLGSFRHITPVSLSVNNEDRMRNKEKELQARLEEEFLKSQPSSTRRVLELVIERVTSAALKELAAAALPAARRRARAAAAALAAAGHDRSTLLLAVEQVYAEQLERLRAQALQHARAATRARAAAALAALLPPAPLAPLAPSAPPAAPAPPGPLHAPLAALAARACAARVEKWVLEHWSTTAVLCKNIPEELSSLLAPGDGGGSPPAGGAALDSPAFAIIALKNHICQLLDGEEGEEGGEAGDIFATLEVCGRCAGGRALCRPPARRALLQLSVDYCIVLVSRKPEQLTEKLLASLDLIWDQCCPARPAPPPPALQQPAAPERRASLSPTFRDFREERAPTPHSDEEGPIGKVVFEAQEVEKSNGSIKPGLNDSEVESPKQEVDPNLEYFERVLCPRNVAVVGAVGAGSAGAGSAGAVGAGSAGAEGAGRARWAALADLLVFLLRRRYLTEDSLTEQCLALYRQDWPQNILENLSVCMRSVSSQWSRSSSGKFTLFLDFLADFCGNMDFEPVDLTRDHACWKALETSE